MNWRFVPDEKESLTLFLSDGISLPSDAAKLIKIFEIDALKMQFILHYMECGTGVRRLRATRTSSTKQPLGCCELARRGAVVIVITGTLSEAPAVGGGAAPGLGRTACSLVPGLLTISRLRRSFAQLSAGLGWRVLQNYLTTMTKGAV